MAWVSRMDANLLSKDKAVHIRKMFYMYGASVWSIWLRLLLPFKEVLREVYAFLLLPLPHFTWPLYKNISRSIYPYLTCNIHNTYLKYTIHELTIFCRKKTFWGSTQEVLWNQNKYDHQISIQNLIISLRSHKPKFYWL